MAIQLIYGAGPYTGSAELPLQGRHIWQGAFTDRDQLIPGLDAGFISGAVRNHALGIDAGTGFHPPDAIVGNRILPFFGEVNSGQDHSCHGGKGQNQGRNPKLKVFSHPLCRKTIYPGGAESKRRRR